MAYLGNRPAESYASFETETFSVSATTNYTLSHAVTNENEIRLVINGVVQQPGSGKAYTASGTTLTLSSATASGDSMYAVYLGRALQTVNPPNASVGASQLASEAVTNAKVASSIITGQTAETSIATDDLILLSDTSASGALKKMTRANFVSGVGGDNTPAFFAYASSNQDISDDTGTKVTLGTEVYDTDSAFASNKFTVPSGEGGKYFFTYSVDCHSLANSNMNYAYVYIYKNGSNVSEHAADFRDNPTRRISVKGSIVLSLSASDYIELYVHIDDTSGNPRIIGDSGISTYLGGHKLIGV